MYAAVEETNIGAILAVMNTTELIVKMRPEKIQARTGFKPITSARAVTSAREFHLFPSSPRTDIGVP